MEDSVSAHSGNACEHFPPPTLGCLNVTNKLVWYMLHTWPELQMCCHSCQERHTTGALAEGKKYLYWGGVRVYFGNNIVNHPHVIHSHRETFMPEMIKLYVTVSPFCTPLRVHVAVDRNLVQ